MDGVIKLCASYTDIKKSGSLSEGNREKLFLITIAPETIDPFSFSTLRI